MLPNEKNRDIASLFSLKKIRGGAISELSHEIDLAIYLNKPTSSKLFSKRLLNKSVDAQTSIIVENSKQ